ncbi:hypothetical protein TIFTF001_003532 [Ficus carica]|uniref:Uncharacterized protein n=1 Tax=Ficus carica TaxID=3494 RepID=A0AA87ZHT0_FICCA|nr:hypothetical protein TIFTF001_003532 [Ficus carica]
METSFLWGRELLQVGLSWRIGDGKRVCVYDDPWIPRLSPFRMVSRPRPGEEDMRVSDLFDGNLAGYSGWNVTRLYSILWNIAVDIIPAVPEQAKIEANSLEGSSDQKWWQFLWHLKIPTKVKGIRVESLP